MSALPPGSVIGVLGGGQLGRMSALAAFPLGFEVHVFTPEPGPATQVTPRVTLAAYEDEAALAAFAEAVDVVTYEFENVPADTAAFLAARLPVRPGPRVLAICQHRCLEKAFLDEVGVATTRWRACSSAHELEQAWADLGGGPCVLKTARFGYDGKGQAVLRSEAEARLAFEQLGSVPLILEGFVRFQRELSIIAVRSRSGHVVTYPLVQNHHEGGILRKTLAPAPGVSTALQAQAVEHIEKLLAHLGYVGTLALELFEVDGQLLANEIAPRVHNTGHWTIEGAQTSQFENHLRAILDLPLGSADALGPSAMLNVIGMAPDARAILAVPDAHLHWYGKEPRPGRKVGHVTVRAPDARTLAERVERLEPLLVAR